jgi:hypothetical protein
MASTAPFETKFVFQPSSQSTLKSLEILRNPRRNLAYKYSRPYAPGLENESDTYIRFIQRPFFKTFRKGGESNTVNWEGDDADFPQRYFCSQKPGDLFWPRPWLVEDQDWMSDKDIFYNKVKENMMAGEMNWTDGDLLEGNLEGAEDRLKSLEGGIAAAEAKKCAGPRVYSAGDFIEAYGGDEDDETHHLYSFEDPQASSTKDSDTDDWNAKVIQVMARDGPRTYTAGDLIEPYEDGGSDEEDYHLYSFEERKTTPTTPVKKSSGWCWADESEELEAMAVNSNGEEASSAWATYDNPPSQMTNLDDLEMDSEKFLNPEEKGNCDYQPRLSQCSWRLNLMALTPKNLNPPLTGLPALRVTNPDGVIFELEERQGDVDFDQYSFYERAVQQAELQRELENFRLEEETEEERSCRIQAESFWADCMARDREQRRMKGAVEFENDAPQPTVSEESSAKVSLSINCPCENSAIIMINYFAKALVQDLNAFKERLEEPLKQRTWGVNQQMCQGLAGTGDRCSWILKALRTENFAPSSTNIPSLRLTNPDGEVFELEESFHDYYNGSEWDEYVRGRDEAQCEREIDLLAWRAKKEQPRDCAIRMQSQKWWADCEETDLQRRRIDEEVVELQNKVRRDLATIYPGVPMSSFRGVNFVLDITGAFLQKLYGMNENFTKVIDKRLQGLDQQLRTSSLKGSFRNECAWFLHPANDESPIISPSTDVPALRVIDPEGNVFEFEEAYWEFNHPDWADFWADREANQPYFQQKLDEFRNVCERADDRAVRLVSEKWWAECKLREEMARMEAHIRELEDVKAEAIRFEQHMAERDREEAYLELGSDTSLASHFSTAQPIELVQFFPEQSGQSRDDEEQAEEASDRDEEWDCVSEPDLYALLPEPNPRPRRNSDPQIYFRSEQLHIASKKSTENNTQENSEVDELVETTSPDESFEEIDLADLSLSPQSNDFDSHVLDADDLSESNSIFSSPSSRASTRATTPEEDPIEKTKASPALADAKREVEVAQAEYSAFITSAYESVKLVKEEYFAKIRSAEEKLYINEERENAEDCSANLIAFRKFVSLTLLQTRIKEDGLKPIDDHGLHFVLENSIRPKELYFVGPIQGVVDAKNGTSFIGLKLVSTWLQQMDIFKNFRSINYFASLRAGIDHTKRKIEERDNSVSTLIRTGKIHRPVVRPAVSAMNDCREEMQDAENKDKMGISMFYNVVGEYVGDWAERAGVVIDGVEIRGDEEVD